MRSLTHFCKQAGVIAAWTGLTLLMIALGALQRAAYIIVMPTAQELGIVMGINVLLTPAMLVRETLLILEAQCPMLDTVNTDWKRYYAGDGPGSFKIGTALTLRKPNRYVSQDGPGIQVEDTQEPSVVLAIEKQKVIPLYFQDSDLTLTIEKFRERYLLPSMSQLHTDIEVYIQQKAAQGIFNSLSVAAFANLASADDYAAIVERLSNYNVPYEDRMGYLSPRQMRGIRTGAAALQSVFDPSIVEVVIKSVSRDLAFKLNGTDVYETPAVYNQLTGTFAGTPLVDGAGQTGSNLATRGWTATSNGVLLQGDVLQLGTTDIVAGAVHAVNPQIRKSLGFRAQFVVQATVNSDANGKASVPIFPPINPATGGTTLQTQYATCDISPADGTALAFGTSDTAGNNGVAAVASTSYTQNIVMHKDCVTLAIVPMDVPPSGVIFAEQETYKGMTLRIIQFYDGNQDQRITRMDVLFGGLCQYPELGCRRWTLK